MKINLNELAREVTLVEGKKESVSIAQVKEVMNILFRMLGEYPVEDVVDTIFPE